MGNTATLTAVWVARLVLASVFAVAAIAKFRDPTSALRGAQDLDVPSALVPLVSRALPVIEAIVAVGLVIPAFSATAASAGLVLLLLFSVAVVRVLAKGRVPMCFCFGSANAAPAGRDSVVRNLALSALCLVVIVAR